MSASSTHRRIRVVAPMALRLAAVVCFLAGVVFAQSIDEAQKQYLAGQYEQVITTASTQVSERRSLMRDSNRDWRILLVKSLLATGRYDEAYTNAAGSISGRMPEFTLRLLAQEAALYRNDPRDAAAWIEDIKQFIQNSSAVLRSEDPASVGQALLLLNVEPRTVLENFYQPAEKQTPPLRDAFAAGGQLALDKHDYKLAAEQFRSGLEKFPNDSELLAGLAQAYEQSNPEEMLKAIASALSINPNQVTCQLLLADRYIDAEQYGEAQKRLDAVLKINPRHPKALAYSAVLSHLHNDTNQAELFRNQALQCYSNNPEVDYLIGLKLSANYRFTEGSAEQRRTLLLDPAYLPARRQLAQDLLRLGKDEEGWQLALAAHKDDSYDVGTYNLATLHDQMVKYTTLTNDHFRVHMTPHEAGLYGDRVMELLSKAREKLCLKYGVELTETTSVEIFADQKDFAVRTFGMPGNPGYLGVCFGPVITANSPATQAPNPANWEDVLWHEFCHVVTLTATKNRMPRWLSEGISVYEERQANTHWGERMNLTYRDMILTNGLTPIEKLSGAFMSASNSTRIQFAYYESSLVVEFIVQRYGFATLTNILADLRQGQEINKSIASRAAPFDDLEKQFAAYAKQQANNLAPGVDLETPPDQNASGTEGSAAALWARMHTNNYHLQMALARELIRATNWNKAVPVLQSLAQMYHGEKRDENPLWLLSVAQRNLRDTNAEWATLLKLAAQETDFTDLYIRLIEVAQERNDWVAAADYAQRMLAVNPLISTPYSALAKAGQAAGKSELSINAYRKLLMLNPLDPSELHYQLARLLHDKTGSEAEAERQVLQALEEAPRFANAQRLLLEIVAKKVQPTPGSTPSITQ